MRKIEELESKDELAAENMFFRKVTHMDLDDYSDSEEESSESEEKPLTRHQALEQLEKLRRRKQLNQAADTVVHGIGPPMDADESSSDSKDTSSSDSEQEADTTKKEDFEQRKKKNKKTTGSASMKLEPLHRDVNQEQEEDADEDSDEDIISSYRRVRKRRRTSNLILF